MVVIGSAISVALAGPASATIFFGEDLNPGQTVPAGGNAETARNQFLSNLVGVGTEDFESFSPGTFADGVNLTFPGVGGSISATLSDPSGSSFISDSPGAGRFATSGSQYLQEVTSGFTLNFNKDVAAFGFYGTDIGDFNGQITLTLANGGAKNFVVNNTVNGPNGSLLFWGFIAGAGETFTSATFGNTAAGIDVFGFDDLTIGELSQVVIPLPMTIPLLGSAIMSLGLLRLRRRA